MASCAAASAAATRWIPRSGVEWVDTRASRAQRGCAEALEIPDQAGNLDVVEPLSTSGVTPHPAAMPRVPAAKPLCLPAPRHPHHPHRNHPPVLAFTIGFAELDR